MIVVFTFTPVSEEGTFVKGVLTESGIEFQTDTPIIIILVKNVFTFQFWRFDGETFFCR